ncbi:CHAT domain-containing protein [Vulgatibacter incomptus]|uniref:TPR repeat protein n=1 Tax=Vulgatibacter incomptus TaxID=1391653 RepID=A0A0K1PFW9_9BACT|nr:CHAT domain-containing protein [Vulgatibacter incomptus]AKU92402.1 TPR repeat protein [Vulgatibacter incomptus]
MLHGAAAHFLIICVAVAGCGDPALSVSEIFANEAGPYRWLEGRSALDLPFAPFDPSRIAPPVEKGRLEGQLYLTDKRGDDDALLGRALFFLWRNGPGDLDRAESRLERVPRDARYWNEQALLLLARPDEFDALEAVDHSLELDPGFLPALFNRGVILEKLSLQGLAIEAWEAYANADPDSPWGLEAIERRARLLEPEPPPVRLESERRKLYDELLALKGASELEQLASRPSSVELLRRLRAVGDTMFERELEVRRAFGPREWLASAKRGELLERLYSETLAGKADEHGLEALSKAIEPTVSLRALRLLAYDAIVRSDLPAARVRLDAVERACRAVGCVEESVLATSDLGTVLAEQANFAEAEEAYRDALDRLPKGFEARRAEILVKQAQLAGALGTPKESQRGLIAAARELARLRERSSLAVALSNLGATARNGFSSAALASRTEAMRLAKQEGRSSTELIAMGGVSLQLAKSGRFDEAKALYERALEEGEARAIDGALVRLLGVAGQVRLLMQEPDEALSTALRVQRLAEDLDLPVQHRGALELAGRASAALGDVGSALHFLSVATDEERALSSRATTRIRRVLMEGDQTDLRVFLARLEAKTGRPDAAWELLASDRLRDLEPDECVIAFASEGGVLSVWSATSTGTRYQESELEASMQRDELVIATKRPWLLFPSDPVARGPGGPMAVSARERLGTAWDPGRCPAEARRVTILETPYTLVGVANRAARLAHADRAVVIARSASTPWPTRRDLGAGLVIHSPRPVVSDRLIPTLPAGPKEASLVRAALPGSRELSGPAATPAGLAHRAAGFDLLHFAVHGESRKRRGAASYLMLAGNQGYLQVGNVLELPLRERNPVVILSSCKSGGKTGDEESDGAGLPWAFLEAGASIVIAYEGDLDDRVALDFAQAFYPALASTHDVSAAFEEALAALRERWPPIVAASFALYT